MSLNTYPYELPPLPYAYNALEPYIDEETMHYHHDKHFASYIDNLNKALEGHPRLHGLTLEQLLSRPVPPDIREAVLHNGGGVYNHTKFFEGLAPHQSASQTDSPELFELIESTYGSLDAFKAIFTKKALEIFGSGWLCLAINRRRSLQIISLANQETVIARQLKPLILFDVWEHAYYLKYKNDREGYLHNLWDVIAPPSVL
ncbi:MAG: superoxide dismutase [Oscillospiraceae bacterium]|nr:superoxide dismutase [Oscillospiraceae bacterium]